MDVIVDVIMGVHKMKKQNLINELEKLKEENNKKKYLIKYLEAKADKLKERYFRLSLI